LARRSHTAPSAEDTGSAAESSVATLKTKLFRFVVVGVSSAIIDMGLLIGLRELGGVSIPLATTIGFWTGLFYNFSLNRAWSFGTERIATPFVRYLTVVGINYLVTLSIVTGGAAAGVPYIVAKIFAIGFGTLGTFVAYNHWVFVQSPDTSAGL
jgi:putative flippase GtrA